MRETFMTPAGFEPAIPASQRPQTHDVDRAATVQHNLTNQHRTEKEEGFCAVVTKTALSPCVKPLNTELNPICQ